MVEFKVEKGVEMPAGTKRINLPLDNMEVGDSFLIPDGNVSNASLHATLSRIKREGVRAYTTRGVTGGRRVWRIK